MNETKPAHGRAGGADAEIERQALAWMDNPHCAFGRSQTAIHSVPRDEAEAVQLAGFNLRLQQRREQIPVLAKLAEAQGIAHAETLEGAAPLLFAHDVYKSYPASLLAKQRFDQITRWLNRLTPIDLTHVDVSGCTSIDDWLVHLRDHTELDVATSSGTSGTMSFFPKSKRDYELSVVGLKIELTQRFGEAASFADIDQPCHVLTPFYRDGHSTVSRLPAYFIDTFCQGDAALLHTALPWKASADLMWLAARLRSAQASGDAGRISVPEGLLARRGEWEQLQAEIPERQAAFIRELIPQLTGQRVFALGITGMFYAIARDGLAEGRRAAFAPGSVVMGGGGGKGVVLPDDAEQVIAEFFGVERMFGGYGMTEQNAYLILCENERFHIPPWVTLLLLDPETGQPLPRAGAQTGRAAFFDMSQVGAWGGIASGDRISASYEQCSCGRTTVHLDKTIQRFSDLAGNDDKLTCAAAPAAQAEALDFLTTL